ncbi:MAG: hypothetical protein WCI11_19145 [Candidatus Methylumidiphilus sp.]
MAAKRILSVGFELASDDVTYAPFDENISLLDWDIVLFRPTIDDFVEYAGTYLNKFSLDDYYSFKLKECSNHWKREIMDAFQNGKTVIVFLSELQNVFVDTGRRTHSGTGRNQRTTRIVESYDNYKCIPVTIKPINTKGNTIVNNHLPIANFD